MRIERAINLEDLRHAAKRALPKLAFDFIDGGAEDEIGMALNRSAFERYRLVPRYLVNVKELRSTATLFASQTPAADQVWDDLVAYRRAWPGNLDALEPSQLLDSVTGAPIAVRTTDRMASAAPTLAS